MTKYFINKMKLEFERKQVTVDVFNIENTPVQDVSFENYDMVGIANPIHSFNTPKIVMDYVRKFPKANIDAFIISTVGDYSTKNHAASNSLIKLLRKKGFNVFYNNQFKMLSNFIVKHNEEQVNKILNRVNSKTPEMVDNILNKVPYTLKSSMGTKCLSTIGKLEWHGTKLMGKFFFANKNCNRCALCVNSCPNKNIKIGKTYAKFKWNCGLCMRCVYLCPNQAIGIHHPFKFIKFDTWYNLNTLENVHQQEK